MKNKNINDVIKTGRDWIARLERLGYTIPDSLKQVAENPATKGRGVAKTRYMLDPKYIREKAGYYRARPDGTLGEQVFNAAGSNYKKFSERQAKAIAKDITTLTTPGKKVKGAKANDPTRTSAIIANLGKLAQNTGINPTAKPFENARRVKDGKPIEVDAEKLSRALEKAPGFLYNAIVETTTDAPIFDYASRAAYYEARRKNGIRTLIMDMGGSPDDAESIIDFLNGPEWASYSRAFDPYEAMVLESVIRTTPDSEQGIIRKAIARYHSLGQKPSRQSVIKALNNAIETAQQEEDDNEN